CRGFWSGRHTEGRLLLSNTNRSHPEYIPGAGWRERSCPDDRSWYPWGRGRPGAQEASDADGMADAGDGIHGRPHLRLPGPPPSPLFRRRPLRERLLLAQGGLHRRRRRSALPCEEGGPGPGPLLRLREAVEGPPRRQDARRPHRDHPGPPEREGPDERFAPVRRPGTRPRPRYAVHLLSR